ncbi:hypothetical protein EBT16_02660, partial [bacterium]|nr:hypothetical protein [bacterium]
EGRFFRQDWKREKGKPQECQKTRQLVKHQKPPRLNHHRIPSPKVSKWIPTGIGPKRAQLGGKNY